MGASFLSEREAQQNGATRTWMAPFSAVFVWGVGSGQRHVAVDVAIGGWQHDPREIAFTSLDPFNVERGLVIDVGAGDRRLAVGVDHQVHHLAFETPEVVADPS